MLDNERRVDTPWYVRLSRLTSAAFLPNSRLMHSRATNSLPATAWRFALALAALLTVVRILQLAMTPVDDVERPFLGATQVSNPATHADAELAELYTMCPMAASVDLQTSPRRRNRSTRFCRRIVQPPTGCLTNLTNRPCRGFATPLPLRPVSPHAPELYSDRAHRASTEQSCDCRNQSGRVAHRSERVVHDRRGEQLASNDRRAARPNPNRCPHRPPIRRRLCPRRARMNRPFQKFKMGRRR